MIRKKCTSMMKRILTMLLVISMIFVGTSITASAEEGKAAKKIISIVYDDSGSMYDGYASWASANYAMQAFAALLNGQDEMYITYMSDVMNGNLTSRQVDLNDVEASVQTIRGNIYDAGGTPLDAVDVAMNQLLSINETDESAQFWLVVLTDGDMQNFGDSQFYTVQEALDSFAGTTMSNGSSLYINYIKIGEGVAKAVKGDSRKGFDSVDAGTDIVPVLSDIANKISGRLLFEESQVKQVDGKTVEVHSDIPMYSISVFSQGSNATVTEAKSESKLSVDRNIALKYPEKNGYSTNESLFGNAAMITNGSNIIQSGDYTITFSEEIDLDNVVLMYQPAIKMKAEIIRNGVTVDDPAELAIGEEIDIEIIPTNPETGDAIKESDLPAGISWKVSYEVDGVVKTEKDGKLLSDVVVEGGTNKIVASMMIPEYAPMSQMITFTPAVEIEYGIIANQPEKSSFPRNNLGKKHVDGELVTFQITGNGEPLTKDQLGKIKLEVKEVSVDESMLEKFYDKFGMKTASIELELNDDGTFSLYPKNLAFPAFMIQAGTYQVTVCIDKDTSITAEGTFEVVPSLADWIDLAKVLGILLLIMYLIYIFFIKAKFCGQTLMIEVYAPKGSLGEGKLLTTEGDEVILKRYGKDLFLPKGACTKLVAGIRVIAGENGDAYIKKSTVVNYDAYGNSGANPIRNYSGVSSALKKVSGNEDKIPEIVALGSNAFYLKQGNRLYKITMR